jgi:glycosyltransferase involved in cell wall biosynthesis
MTGRLRIATVVTRFEAGAGVVALRGALALDPARYDVEIIAGSGDRLLAEAEAAGLPVRIEPSLRSPIAPLDDLRALHRLTAILGEGNFDVVHTHSAKAGTLGRLAARRAGNARIVHTFHGLPFHEFQSRLRRGLYVDIERYLGRFTDVALCVGTGVAVEVVRRRLIAPERVRTIGVAVDAAVPKVTDAGRASARRELGIEPGDRVVGAVGRLAYQKAPEDFVAALIALDRADVVGVWVGDGELAGQVALQAARAPEHIRIMLAGERADVAALLPAFDVFALPSRYEGLPVAIVEAMACGVPVVATAVNAVPDVVVPGTSGLLVPPQRPDLMARAIGYLLDHRDHAAAMAATARERAIGHNPNALRDALVSAYERGPSDLVRLASRPADRSTVVDLKEHERAR